MFCWLVWRSFIVFYFCRYVQDPLFLTIDVMRSETPTSEIPTVAYLAVEDEVNEVGSSKQTFFPVFTQIALPEEIGTSTRSTLVSEVWFLFFYNTLLCIMIHFVFVFNFVAVFFFFMFYQMPILETCRVLSNLITCMSKTCKILFFLDFLQLHFKLYVYWTCLRFFLGFVLAWRDMIFHSILLISTDHLRNILDPVERLSTWMCPDILIPMLSAIGLCLSFFYSS